MANRLTKIFDSSDTTVLEDYLSCVMATIEDGLIQSGFIPGEDYTRKDLFAAAMPLVSHGFSLGKVAFTSSWPNPQNHEQEIDY